MSYMHELLSACQALAGCDGSVSARLGPSVHRERFARSGIGGVLSNRNIAIHIEPPPSLA